MQLVHILATNHLAVKQVLLSLWVGSIGTTIMFLRTYILYILYCTFHTRDSSQRGVSGILTSQVPKSKLVIHGCWEGKHLPQTPSPMTETLPWSSPSHGPARMVIRVV